MNAILENLPSVIVLLIVAVLFVVILVKEIRKHKNGGGCSSCGGNCAACGMCCHAETPVKSTDKKKDAEEIEENRSDK